MKTVLLFLLSVSLSAFAAHAADDNPMHDPLFRPVIEPPTTISGVEILKPEGFAELYNVFLDPIYRSDFYMVIDRIVIDTSSGEASQWTADIYLETGEHIALHDMNAFYGSNGISPPPFKRATKSVFHQLEGFLKTDRRLKKFFREEFPHHSPA